MNSLKGKIIVVTGGSGLIGRSIIKNIVSNGAIAINAEINVIDNLDEGIVNCDVTDADSVKKCIEKVLEKYNVIDGWVRESIPELINNVLSLSDSAEKDQAKRILKQRMDTLYDKELKKYMYSICRSLKILN